MTAATTHEYLHLGTRSSRPRILLADDDPDLRVLLSLALELDGYDVVQAEDGLRMVDCIGNLFLGWGDRAPVDIIISDVRMPGLSGLEILAGFRRADWSTPFVLMTAFGSDELHAEARRLGAAAVLDKPFDIDELRLLLRRLVPLDLGGLSTEGQNTQNGGMRARRVDPV